MSMSNLISYDVPNSREYGKILPNTYVKIEGIVGLETEATEWYSKVRRLSVRRKKSEAVGRVGAKGGKRGARP